MRGGAAAGKAREKERRERARRETRTLPQCLSPYLRYVPPFLYRRLLPSLPSCTFRFLPCIVSAMIHWIPRRSRANLERRKYTYKDDTSSRCTRPRRYRAECFADFRILPSSKELNLLGVPSVSLPREGILLLFSRLPVTAPRSIVSRCHEKRSDK